MTVPPETDLQAMALALLAAALFGAALITAQIGLKHMNALSGARVSIPAATALFWLLSPWLDLTGWQAGAAGMFAVVGVFFPAAVTLLSFEANRRLGPSVAGALGSTAPLFAVAGAALFLGEALGIRELVATTIIVLGTMALSVRQGGDTGLQSLVVLWLPLSAAALRALAQVLTKAGLVLWPNPFAAVLAGYTVSTAVVWGASLLKPGQTFTLNGRGAAWFALTGVLNGSAVLSMYGALNAGPVQMVAPVVATYPLFTLALGTAVLRRERLSSRLLTGVALTVAGVVILLTR